MADRDKSLQFKFQMSPPVRGALQEIALDFHIGLGQESSM